MRFYMFTLFHLTEAATELLLFRLHGEPERVDARLYSHFTLARDAAGGDSRLDASFDWLYEASRRIVAQRTAQLELLPEASQLSKRSIHRDVRRALPTSMRRPFGDCATTTATRDCRASSGCKAQHACSAAPSGAGSSSASANHSIAPPSVRAAHVVRVGARRPKAVPAFALGRGRRAAPSRRVFERFWRSSAADEMHDVKCEAISASASATSPSEGTAT